MGQSVKAGISEVGSKGSLDSACDSADGLKAEFCSDPSDRAASVTGYLCQDFSNGDGCGYPREGLCQMLSGRSVERSVRKEEM